MDDNATRKVAPTEHEQQRNREREVLGFNLGLWGIAALVVIVVVVVAWFLI